MHPGIHRPSGTRDLLALALVLALFWGLVSLPIQEGRRKPRWVAPPGFEVVAVPNPRPNRVPGWPLFGSEPPPPTRLVPTEEQEAPASAVEEAQRDSVFLVEVPREEHSPTGPPQEVFLVVEEMPEPIGGLEEIARQIRYPSEALRRGVEGEVVLAFTVTPTGRVEDIQVIKGLGYGCTEEAIRVIRQTLFRPGRQRGVPVPVRVQLPIRFRIEPRDTLPGGAIYQG
jgi:TonB family protein|nr:MAG: hypothetical protein KatS3mg041_1814 [Bacteroidota bacterium]